MFMQVKKVYKVDSQDQAALDKFLEGWRQGQKAKPVGLKQRRKGQDKRQ